MKQAQQSHRFSFWKYVIIATTVVLSMTATSVSAHALWKPGSITPPRSSDLFNNLKVSPCGGLPRGSNPAVFQTGSEIKVEWIESINHKGYFNINFSPAGDANFIPLSIKKTATDLNPQVNYIDDQDTPIPANQVHNFSGFITLPANTVCTDCTLQIIQVMQDTGTNSFYYSCSDINLVANNSTDVTPPADVAGLAAAPGDTLANLSWTNPAADFYRTLVLQSASPITSVPNTSLEYQVGNVIGTASVVYVGNGQAHQVTGLSNGSTYYYKAYAYDLNKNYAPGVPVQVTLPTLAVNQAPVVRLLSIQGGNDTSTVTTNGGNVQVQAQVTDANPGDQHTYDWSGTDVRLLDLGPAADNTFEFDPMTLTAGTTYTLKVTVTDNGSPVLSGAAAPLTVSVVNGAATTPPPPAATPIAGGCTVNPTANFSPLFPLMLGGAVIYLVITSRRRRAAVRDHRRD